MIVAKILVTAWILLFVAWLVCIGINTVYKGNYIADKVITIMAIILIAPLIGGLVVSGLSEIWKK